jgi:hypothetical protein
MSKPLLATDLGNYNTNLAAHFPDAKTPSPKDKREKHRKRGRNHSDHSGGKEGQKSSRTDQVTPPIKEITNISKTTDQETSPATPSLSTPTHSPTRSLTTFTTNRGNSPLSLETILNSPVHSKSRSPSPHLIEEAKILKAFEVKAIQPLQYQHSPNTIPRQTLTSNMSNPKPLRPSLKELQRVQCVTAAKVRNAITNNDFSEHPPPDDGPHDEQQVILAMSNFMINRQNIFCVKVDNLLKKAMVEAMSNDKNPNDFFHLNSERMNTLSDHINTTVKKMLNDKDIIDIANTHFTGAQSHIATIISSQLEPMLTENQDFFNKFTPKQPKPSPTEINMLDTIIYAANFDSRLKSLLFESLPTAKTIQSVNTLSTQLSATKIDTFNNTKATNENKNNISKAAFQIGHLKTSQTETSHRAVETQIRIHNINTIVMDNHTNFKDLDENKQKEEIMKIVATHGERPGACTIIKPRTNAKHFDALAIVTFKQTSHKYTFERAFAAWKRTSPVKNEKLTISRAPPGKAPGDLQLDTPNDIRQQIAGLYQIKMAESKVQHPGIKHYGEDELTKEEIQSMPVQLKTKHRPFATYWEFLDPTNNTTYNTHMPGSNPFDHHDFTNPIPNPTTRNESKTRPEYRDKVKLRPPKRREQPQNHS